AHPHTCRSDTPPHRCAHTHTYGLLCHRCHSTSPPPILCGGQARGQPAVLSDSEISERQAGYVRTDGRLLGHAAWSSKTASLCSERLNGGSLSWSTQSLGPSSHQGHKRTLSLARPVPGAPPATIRKKISEWECRRVSLPRMSLCLDKRSGVERVGGSEGCPSMLSSPCSEQTFDFKGVRRMSTAFSDCSFAEEEEGAPDKELPGRFQKRTGKAESSATFLRALSARKEKSAVLNRIQKIEQALKESPGPAPPAYLNNCYAPDKTKHKASSGGARGAEDSDSACGGSKRVSVCSVSTEPDTSAPSPSPSDRFSKARQRYSVISARSQSPEPAGQPMTGAPGTPVNPVPKPKRTFEYDAKRGQKSAASSPSNGLLPPGRGGDSPPPPLPSTPAPCAARGLKTEGSPPRRPQDRELCESEDAASLPSSFPAVPTENGTGTTETRSRLCSKSTLEENAYEDIVEKENPYEDVDLKRKSLVRKSCLFPESDRSWSSMERKLNSPPQLPLKPSSQSLRLSGPGDRKSHRSTQLSKRHSHDEMLLLPQLGVSPSTSVLLEDGYSNASDSLVSHRHLRIPKLVQRINSIYCTKRGKKRLKKLSMSNMETASLRDDNSESESDSDDRFKAHTQRLLKLQSILRRAPSYRTLELQLIEWQERELFEYFVVVSLKKKPTKNSFSPEVTYQFPKLERATKQMREAEQRLKAIPQFCFPDARDWSPVSDYSSETFSFMLTGADGSRRFGYCRRLLVRPPHPPPPPHDPQCAISCARERAMAGRVV
uniref:DENN domain containing 2B n=1 Tax=Gadus morhua TaxID=8049 RepID=A0A8C5B0B2_GADMO